MTNIVPQAATLNRGAWLQTEAIVECYRDIDELLVIGGVLWGQNPADDHFVRSHGIATPDAFWKLILRGTGQTGERFPEVPAFLRGDKPEVSWIVPIGCEKS